MPTENTESSLGLPSLKPSDTEQKLAIDAAIAGMRSSKNVGFAIVSQDGVWMAANAFVCARLGLPEAQLIGRQLRDYFAFPTSAMQVWKEADTDEATAESDFLHCCVAVNLRCADQQLRAMHASCRIVDIKAESAFLVTLIDIHAVVHHAMQAHRTAVQAKDTLAVVAHDIRNPLSTILLSAETMDTSAGHRVTRAARYALGIAEDLVSQYRWQASKALPVDPAPATLDDMGQFLLETFSRQGLHPPLVVSSSGNLEGRWDVGRLTQAVSNLVANALRFRQPGTVVSLSFYGSSENHVIIEIHNYGPVVPKHEMQNIFLPLFSNEAGSTPTNLGLGLFIVKKIAQAHHGIVDVTSTAADGTTFRLQLPRRVC